MITMGPTGNLIHGDVLDCDKKGFTRALKALDPLLYIQWNPAKLRGYGCWEIRRAPSTLSVVEAAPIPGGGTIVRLELLENNIMNHVLDVAYLDYRVLQKLRDMDTWAQMDAQGYKSYEDVLQYEEYKWREKEISRRDEVKKYQRKENKRLGQDLADLVRSGHSLHRLFQTKHWKK